MNENIDLTKILRNCPKGTKFYSLVHGEVTFVGINEISKDYPIEIILTGGLIYYYTKAEVDEKLGLYVSNNELNNKLLDYYNKLEVETLIDSKINTALDDILSEEY